MVQIHPPFHPKTRKVVMTNERQRFPKPLVPVKVRAGAPLLEAQYILTTSRIARKDPWVCLIRCEHGQAVESGEAAIHCCCSALTRRARRLARGSESSTSFKICSTERADGLEFGSGFLSFRVSTANLAGSRSHFPRLFSKICGLGGKTFLVTNCAKQAPKANRSSDCGLPPSRFGGK
jgi:hypothetical protein